MSTQQVKSLLDKYRDAAAGTSTSPAKVQNAWADMVHDCYRSLRQSEDGRQGIIELMKDSNPDVRLWAASHSLEWAPEAASHVLEDIRDSEGFPCSFTAEITLEEFKNGSLRFGNDKGDAIQS